MLGIRDVEEYLRARGLRGEVLKLGPGRAKTSYEAARSVGCRVEQIAKTVLLVGERSNVLVVLSGAKRVDLGRVSELLGERLRLAPPPLVEELTGYPVGGLPPFGHKQKLKTLIDKSIIDLKEVYTSAGSEDALLKIAVDDLLKACEGEVVEVSK